MMQQAAIPPIRLLGIRCRAVLAVGLMGLPLLGGCFEVETGFLQTLPRIQGCPLPADKTYSLHSVASRQQELRAFGNFEFGPASDRNRNCRLSRASGVFDGTASVMVSFLHSAWYQPVGQPYFLLVSTAFEDRAVNDPELLRRRFAIGRKMNDGSFHFYLDCALRAGVASGHGLARPGNEGTCITVTGQTDLDLIGRSLADLDPEFAAILVEN
jgi:hypothetical protein